jgi:hypothetical protein
VHAEHEHRQARAQLLDLLQRLEAAAAAERDIEQD